MHTWSTTAGLMLLVFQAFSQNYVLDKYGAIIRGDTSKKSIAVVFTGHEFADGGEVILKALKSARIKSSFFLTGYFYRQVQFQTIIRHLKKDGHYLGAHSDKHLLYADWTKRDSTLVTEEEFTTDLGHNYLAMENFGIRKNDAPYFLPPYEWYNKNITQWTDLSDLKLVNFTPGTRSTADYTYPEMAERYIDSEKIFQSIMNYETESATGLNGFILLIHIGTDPRRSDKFYNRLSELLQALQGKGYTFLRIDELLK